MSFTVFYEFELIEPIELLPTGRQALNPLNTLNLLNT